MGVELSFTTGGGAETKLKISTNTDVSASVSKTYARVRPLRLNFMLALENDLNCKYSL